jgi:hypothetical protein
MAGRVSVFSDGDLQQGICVLNSLILKTISTIKGYA